MGKMKGAHLRTAAQKLVKEHSDSFSGDYEDNKKKITALGLVRSGKRERNKLVGELTNLKKREARKKAAEAHAA